MHWVGKTLPILLLAGLLVMPSPVRAVASGQLLITEVLPGTADNAKQEFIELYNCSDQPLEFRDGSWRIEMASSSATDWQKPLRTIVLDGYLYPDNYYLIGSAYSQNIGGSVQTLQYPDQADIYFASALSAPAGHIRLVHTADNSSEEISDVLEWGSASTASLSGQAVFPAGSGIAAGSSLNRFKNEAGNYVDSGNSADDFGLMTEPQPVSTTADQPWLEPPADAPLVDNNKPTQSLPVLPLEITEILPNPAAPYSDDDDEYIEIFNPNSEAVSLAGYSLQTGTTKPHTYKFPAEASIAAQAYAVFYSAVTGLSLSNSGGQVKLLDPYGSSSSLADVYETAKDGLVWQLYDGFWQWSAKQTPGAVNEYLAVDTIKKTTKPTTSSKKTTADKATATDNNDFTEELQPAYIHNAVLAAVVGLALLYGGYEYRHDLANKFRQLRSYRSARRQPRPTAAR